MRCACSVVVPEELRRSSEPLLCLCEAVLVHRRGEHARAVDVMRPILADCLIWVRKCLYLHVAIGRAEPCLLAAVKPEGRRVGQLFRHLLTAPRQFDILQSALAERD